MMRSQNVEEIKMKEEKILKPMHTTHMTYAPRNAGKRR